MFVVFVLFFLVFLSKSVAKFDPYADNGGTIIGLAGKDFCIMAADTRLSDQYMIRSRSISRLFEIDGASGSIVLSASGCLSDAIQLSALMEAEARGFLTNSKRKISLSAASHLLGTDLQCLPRS
jgi:20S proteasome subunit beta 6